MPAVRTVSHWKDDHPEFLTAFGRAREEGFDSLASDCLEIADDERHDWKLSKKGAITDEVSIARARLRVDTRLKLLAKWAPKRYGEKPDITTQGEKTPLERKNMIAMMQKSPSYFRQIEKMVEEARQSQQDTINIVIGGDA